MTERPLKIGETRPIDPKTGDVKIERGRWVPQCAETEAITAKVQVEKLIGLCDDPVSDTHSFDLAIKAAREARLCLTRAEKAMRSTLKAIGEATTC